MYGGVRTWVEGLQARMNRATGWSLQPVWCAQDFTQLIWRFPNGLKDFWTVSRRCPADWWFSGDPAPLARDKTLHGCAICPGEFWKSLLYKRAGFFNFALQEGAFFKKGPFQLKIKVSPLKWHVSPTWNVKILSTTVNHIVAYHLYKGSCFRWIGDMWRAYVKVVFPRCNNQLLPIIFHYTNIHDIPENHYWG